MNMLVYLLKEKSKAKEIFKNFNVMINTQFQTKIQIFRTNNGTEYFNSILGPYLREHCIIHQSSCIATTQQNGISERKDRHLLQVPRSLMFTTNVPKYFLGEAVLIASYLINRMPTRVLQYQTPIEVLKNCYPSIRLVSSFPPKIFGCSIFVNTHAQKKNETRSKSPQMSFLGIVFNPKRL